MADYKKLYHKMFNVVTDAEILAAQAALMMRSAQQECEEMHTEADDTPIALADMPED